MKATKSENKKGFTDEVKAAKSENKYGFSTSEKARISTAVF